MARQFDIVENSNEAGRDLYPFLLNLQHDRTTTAGSVIVAPVTSSSRGLEVRERLHLSLDVDGRRYVAITEDLSAVPRSHIGRVVGSAAARHYEIVRAIDMLFTGI